MTEHRPGLAVGHARRFFAGDRSAAATVEICAALSTYYADMDDAAAEPIRMLVRVTRLAAQAELDGHDARAIQWGVVAESLMALVETYQPVMVTPCAPKP